jgi:predicted dehydrogenase
MSARIGILGCGFWATYFYMPFLRDHPDAECVGVVHPEADALRALKDGFDLEIATSDVDELLAAGLDGVIVSSSNDRHREHAEAALRSGAHVLVEKPMTVTLADAQVLATTARECGREITMAHGWNYSRQAAWAADAMRDEVIGKITWANGQMASSLTNLFAGREGYGTVEVEGHQFEASPHTWADPNAGGGYSYGQIIHQLGLAFALIDSPPREVFARFDMLESGVDVGATISVEFENGAVGSFSGHGRLPWNTRYPLGLRIAGERGVLSLDFERERADVHLQRGGARDYDIPERHQAFDGAPPDLELEVEAGDGLYDNDGPAQHLVDLCLGVPSTDRAPAIVGVRSVAVVEAAWRSSRERRAIAVEVE